MTPTKPMAVDRSPDDPPSRTRNHASSPAAVVTSGSSVVTLVSTPPIHARPSAASNASRSRESPRRSDSRTRATSAGRSSATCERHRADTALSGDGSGATPEEPAGPGLVASGVPFELPTQGRATARDPAGNGAFRDRQHPRDLGV